MKSAQYRLISGSLVVLSLLLVPYRVLGQQDHRPEHDALSRTLYLSSGFSGNKGGWRPIMSSGLSPGLPSYNFGNVINSQNIGQKIMTGPAVIETKVISPHAVGISPLGGDFYGSGILSTSTRPLVTRDVNKLTTIAQTYKPSMFPQNNLNLNVNAPVNSYLNPFQFPSNPGFNHFKSFQSPAYQYDSNIFIRHPQPMISHRPVYNKLPGQVMMGKRLKHNQLQAQMLQQLATNHYHQSAMQQSYQNSLKKPQEAFSRPADVYPRPNEAYSKPVNHQKHVNPQESLSAQTKTKIQTSQGVAAVTYKPALSSHFQQYGLKEETFGPIPSSILGSFSSFGHASIKARDPYSGSKNGYLPTTPTKIPFLSTEISAISTANSNIQVSTQDPKPAQQYSKPIPSSEDYTRNLVPPPQTIIQHSSTQFNDHNVKNFTKDERRPSNFIPSPLDPLSKNQQNQLDQTKVKQSGSFSYNSNQQTRRPEMSSFFDTTLPPSVTTDPFESQSTNAVPESLLVQVPPPYTTINSYNGQAIKIENVGVNKDKYQSFTVTSHHTGPSKYIFDDVKYFPVRGHDYFDPKFQKHNSKDKIPLRGSYEVTENWGSSGETNTQPTLHTWLNPAQSYKHYSNGRPKLPSFNVIPNHDDRINPLPYFPGPADVPEPSKPFNDDVSTIYSTLVENNKQKPLAVKTEDIHTLADIESQKQKKPVGDETYDLAAPINTTFETEVPTKVTPTQNYEELNTYQPINARRKPSRYRPQYESSTPSSADDDIRDFTTRFETYKEQAHETENDVQVSELPTIPPNKHFRRPLSPTTTVSDNWNDDLPRKKNKHRRRRPLKTSTTEEVSQEPFTTEVPHRNYRYKTTTPYPDSDVVTKSTRQKLRLPSIHKLRPTKPPTHSEFTSSAQPTMLPTIPVTIRSKLHSRVRATTLSSLDLDDLLETTTERASKYQESNDNQSSIMKIAKDNHSNRSPSNKIHSTIDYEIFNQTPDYSHKQDEKDTPTSDVSVSTTGVKYSAQKLRDSSSNNNEADKVLEVKTKTEDEAQSSEQIKNEPTSSSFFDENISENNIQTSQTTRSEQLFTELKSGHRGTTKSDENLRAKQERPINFETVAPSGDEEIVSTTPIISTNKSHRLKVKPNKYDSNRPRFSVKDYRNRLNQYTSTSTDKTPHYTTSESTPRLRFPNRARFPSFKEQNGDSKPAGSDVSTTTEIPRKKFTPKDPRHKDDVNDETNETHEKNIVPSGRLSINFRTSTAASDPLEKEVVTKPTHRVRGSLRRDPNRLKTSTTTTESSIDNVEKSTSKSNNIYTNLKRPSSPTLKKRLPPKNKTVEATAQTLPEDTSVSVEMTSEGVSFMEEKNETTTEKSTSETAIMKIAKDERKHPTSEEITENLSVDHSQRVSDLTLASSKEYNTPGLFKSVSPNTRKVPNYFTIATDDPILPIEAFFPQLNQKKES